jgi:DNA-binding CsgD family transcriptional regulator
MTSAHAATRRADFVGRDREMELLAAHRRAASQGNGRIVLVGGEAGIGKSRLLKEFAATVAGSRSMLATSRCVEFVQTPLAPLRELLAMLERRSETTNDPATSSLIERLDFERLSSSQLETLPGALLFDAIQAGFSRLANRGTLVLIVEDVHWADRSTLAFLTHFADIIESRRVLLVASFRSEEVRSGLPSLPQFAKLLAHGAVSEVQLRPLDERATRELVRQTTQRSPKPSSSIIDGVVRRCEGNPFFAEELLKSADGAAPSSLPLSIRSAVLARVSQLEPAGNEIVSLAAVLGQRFSVDRLVTLSNGDRAAVLDALQHARRLGLLDDESTAPGEVAFRHSLTQEVLYGELLAERVRPLHEAIAVELERGDPQTECVQLAHHWRRAGNLRQAAIYDELAGDRAAAVGAFADAVSFYERAMTTMVDPTPAMAHKLGVALGALDRFSTGIEHLRHAARLYWQSADYEGYATNASALGAQLYNSGDPEGATAVYAAAVAALQPHLPSDALTMLRARMAYNCIAALDVLSAATFARDLPQTIDDPIVAMNVAKARFRIAAMNGDIATWREHATAAIEAAVRAGDAGVTLRHAHTQVALDAVALGEIKSARTHFSAAIGSQRDRTSPSALLALAASSFEHTLRGEFATAAILLDEARAVSDQAYAIQVHVRSAQFALGICNGDDAYLRRDDSESFLLGGAEHGMKLALGVLGGPYAWALGLRGETEQAALWTRRMADSLLMPHRFMFAFLAGAQYGDGSVVTTMRAHLATAAAVPSDRVNKAVAALFDAFAARRALISADAAEPALDAATRFDAIGWPWFAARAYELGGDVRRALETYRSLGSMRDAHRLEAGRDDASSVSLASALSSREREVGSLVASGHSNEEIAHILHISSRTAEKHVSSALRKLHLRSRLQLGQVLARSQNH